MTCFGNIKVFDHDVLFHRLPYHRKSPDALLNLLQRHRSGIRPDLTWGMFALDRFSGPERVDPLEKYGGATATICQILSPLFPDCGIT
jgi:hypothetical protein